MDVAVQQVVATGESAQVIMEFETTAERDAAFSRMLNAGAAVRTLDTEGGPALVVLSKASTFSSELAGATQVSLDARVVASAAAAQKGKARPKAARAAAVKTRAAKVTQARAKAPVAPAAPVVPPPPPAPVSYDSLSVAVIDSGLLPSLDLPASRIRAYKDFVSGGTSPVDLCGHGTHVAGAIGGNGYQSFGEYQGVKPNVNLVVLRVLGDDCSGKTSDVIDALEWVARNHQQYKIKVVNLSLGHPVFESVITDPMVKAVERLSRKGIVVVTAAGNMGINPKTGLPGYGGVGVPCNSPSALCVGALDTRGTATFDDDTVASFSSRGPTRFDMLVKPDVVANGVNVISLNADGSKIDKGNAQKAIFGNNNNKKAGAAYMSLSGTSMASPMVAGTAARMLTVNPRLSANMVKLFVQFTARVLPGVDTLTQGAGALNIQGAVRLAKIVDARAAHGTNWLTTQRMPKANRLSSGQVVTWGKRVIYGDRFVVGNGAAVHMARWDDNIAWGYDSLSDNIVWGNMADDDNIVWGNIADDNIAWGANIVWGFDNIVWGFWDDNIVWGNVHKNDVDNIVWGNCSSSGKSRK